MATEDPLAPFSRSMKVRARSYLERIRAGLDADIINYRNHFEFWKHVSEFGAQGLSYAETGNSKGLTTWDLVLCQFQASQLAEFYTSDAAYEELKSGGDLGPICDRELRNRLASYYRGEDNPVLTERPAYREHVRGLIPLNIRSCIRDNCYTSDLHGEQTMHQCEAPVDTMDADQLIATISRDKQLMSELRYWMSAMHVASIVWLGRTIAATQL